MRCLVLAFETFDDLCSDWQSYETVDAYGSNGVSPADVATFRGDCATAITVHNRQFSIMAPDGPVVVYDHCFVRHPDPWGEPRNWLRAIARLGESLRGDIRCVHYHQHEGLAFNFLLIALLDKENVRLESTVELEPGKFQFTWRINAAGLQTDMQTRYRNRFGKIMRRFYTEMGPFLRDVPYFL
jgi:hypothetical protein